MAKEMHEFQAETKQLLDLMVNSIYTNKEIFLRELISNASDAIDKLHFESLTNREILEGDEDYEIYLVPDKDSHTLTISDNGLGMTKDEVLTQAFAKCPLGRNGELFLYTEETSQYGNKYFCGNEFKTLADAKSAAVLKNSDTWQLDEMKVSRSSFPFSERELLVLHFTDGRVVEVGTTRISDM